MLCESGKASLLERRIIGMKMHIESDSNKLRAHEGAGQSLENGIFILRK